MVVMNHLDRPLFIVWSFYQEEWAANAADAYFSNGGKTLIYLGEKSDSSCANDRFFELLDYYAEKVDDIDIPRHYGLKEVLWSLFTNKR